MKISKSLWATAIASVFLIPMSASAQVFFSETFNTDGDGTRYELVGRGHEDTNLPNQASGWGIWGHNFDAPADEIGLVQTAPAKRAAILWSHEDPVADFDELISPESLEVWLSLVQWATDEKANAKIGVFPGTLSSGAEVVSTMLTGAGYTIEEILVPEDVEGSDIDLLIHSSETGSPSFTSVPMPVISFSGSDHDDLAVAGIGSAVDFFDPVEIEVTAAGVGHPALGGKEGTIPWTTDAAQLQTIGKAHPGGTALATVVFEDPNTGDDVEAPAIFVIDEGSPVLGAFNPPPEGEGYIIGAALNKFGDAEKQLILNPVDISGREGVQMAIWLAATAADFEVGDFLRLEVEVDGTTHLIEEFFGTDASDSDCHKGLSNNEAIAGEVGDICLPTDNFGEYFWDIPAGDSAQLVITTTTTWGNEIVGIDNIRFFTGVIGPVDDLNGDGNVDVGDIDLLAAQIAAGSTDSKYDIDGDGSVASGDLSTYVTANYGSWIGDANGDGEFNSSDFVSVFTAGKFEQDVDASWSEGDWNGDGRFNSSDFVSAFTDGGFELGPRPGVQNVPEPTSVLAIGLFGFVALYSRFRKS